MPLLAAIAAGVLAGWSIWRLFGSMRPTHEDVESRIQEAREWREYVKPPWAAAMEAEAELHRAEAAASQEEADRMRLDGYPWEEERWRS